MPTKPTAQQETNARIARVLSALLQGAVAKERTGRDGETARAFVREYEPEILLGNQWGDAALVEVYQALWIDAANAIYSLVQHVSATDGQSTMELLTDLLRTYRAAGRP